MEVSPSQPAEQEHKARFSSSKFFLFLTAFLFLTGLVVLSVALLRRRQTKLEQKAGAQQAQELVTAEYGPTDFPLSKEYGSYHFFCIGGEIETQQPEFELPAGHKISHTIPCRYYDANGQEQELHLPLYAYHPQKLTAKNLGYIPEEEPSSLIESVKRSYTQQSPGAVGKLERAGWTGPGHIFYVAVALPTADNDLSHLSSGGYFNQALQQLFSPQAVEQFVQVGDLSTQWRKSLGVSRCNALQITEVQRTLSANINPQ